MNLVSEYLKKATELKEKKDYEGACNLVKQALNSSFELKEPQPITTWLRLALYLQDSGKNDEGWQLLVDLLAKGHPQANLFHNYDNVSRNLDLVSIHDKMRLFLQREKKFDAAIIHGIKSFLYNCKNVHYNAFVDKDEWLNKEFLKEWKIILNARNIENEISISFKKSSKQGQLKIVSKKISDYLKTLDSKDFDVNLIVEEIKSDLIS